MRIQNFQTSHSSDVKLDRLFQHEAESDVENNIQICLFVDDQERHLESICFIRIIHHQHLEVCFQ